MTVVIVGVHDVKAKLNYTGTLVKTELARTSEEVAVLLEETAKDLAPFRTGRLRESISSRVRLRAGLFTATEGIRGAEITVSLVVNRTIAPYAVLVQRGTGIYAGHTPWTVTPKFGKALAFSAGGQDLVRAHATIKGMHGRDFIEEAFRVNEATIIAMYEEAGRRMVS